MKLIILALWVFLGLICAILQSHWRDINDWLNEDESGPSYGGPMPRGWWDHMKGRVPIAGRRLEGPPDHWEWRDPTF